MDTSEFLTIELRIQGADIESILARWESGKWLLAQREGKKRLPDGLVGKLVEQTGKSERELQRRMKLAEKFSAEEELRRAATEFEWSWNRMTNELLVDAPGSRPRAVSEVRPTPKPDPAKRPAPPPTAGPGEPGYLTTKFIGRAKTELWRAQEDKDSPLPKGKPKKDVIILLKQIIKIATALLNRYEGKDVSLSFSDEELEEFRRDVA